MCQLRDSVWDFSKPSKTGGRTRANTEQSVLLLLIHRTYKNARNSKLNSLLLHFQFQQCATAINGFLLSFAIQSAQTKQMTIFHISNRLSLDHLISWSMTNSCCGINAKILHVTLKNSTLILLSTWPSFFVYKEI